MAALTEQQRVHAAREWIREAFERLGGTATLTTAQIKAALDAADDWADANAVAYNNALPLPFRTTATAAQKALLLAYVCMKRANLL